MINYVIKSDGTKEEFNPNKLNIWAEFASDHKVNWSDISLRAYRKCFDGCTTKDLHKAMIDACVEKEDHKHLQMAGRLLIGDIYKDVFGGFKGIPSLQDFYTNMVSRGYWAEMDYSEEEMMELSAYIDHSKDLTYNYTSLRQLKDKYLVQDRVKKQLLETPQFMFMGMAMQNMEKQPKERRVKDIIQLYTYLSDMKINAPTPMLVNMRTTHKGYASCCVFTTDDTAASLAAGDHISYMMTCASAGIGGFIKTRSKGDSVRGGTIQHLGKTPYLRMNQAAVHANLQASRGGSSTQYFNALDPEVQDLLALKNPTTVVQKQIKDIDYALVVNQFFAKRVAKGEDWMLISYGEAPDLHESMYTGDIKEFERLYEHYYHSNHKKEIVKARDIAIQALTEAVETGRIYMFWADEANKHSPFNDKIYSSNL